MPQESRRQRDFRLTLAAALAASCACRAETIDKPTAPSMSEIVAAFATPNGTLDASTGVEARTAVDAAIDGLIGAGVPQLIYDTVVKAANDAEAKNGATSSAIDSHMTPSLGTEGFDGDGFARLTRICSGWAATPVADDATSGHLQLTFGFDAVALDPVVWGGAEKCRYLTSGRRLLLDHGSSADDVRVYLGPRTKVSDLGTSPMILALDLKASLDDRALAAKLVVQFTPATTRLELLVPVSSGSLVLSLESGVVVQARAKNGVFACTPATHKCVDSVGFEVTL